MNVFAAMSLRWRLLAGFGLCALFGAASAIGANIALHNLGVTMAQSSEDVGNNITRQNSRTEDLSNLRAFLDRISQATTLNALPAAVDVPEPHGKGIDRRDALLDEMKQSLDMRRLRLNKEARLTVMRADATKLFEQIQKTVAEIADNTEFDSALAIEGALGKVKGEVEKGPADKKDLAGQFAKVSALAAQSVQAVKSTQSVMARCDDLTSVAKDIYSATDTAFVSYLKISAETLTANIHTQLSAITPVESRDSINKHADELCALISAMALERQEFLDAVKIGRAHDERLNRAFAEADRDCVSAMTLLQNDTSERLHASIRSGQSWQTIVILLSAFGLLLSATLGMYFAHAITHPVRVLMNAAQRIAAGDLKQKPLPVTSGDETGQMTEAFNTMLGSLKDMTTQIRTATQNIGSATTEILASTQQQAASTSEQAAAVQQTTATVEEINRSGNQVAEHARQVAGVAEAASSTGTAGIQAARYTNQNMEAIREQAQALSENIVMLSEKAQAIGEIVATVNDIAEQSNVLALNAAIEAAGAGEFGVRFSVVANELKNHADQSKTYTRQVRTILNDIQKGINTSVMLTEETVKRVELGKEQADVAERTIRQMAESTVGSVQAFQQIVAATNQQRIGFEHVTQALKNIRQGSQQTAVGTQQTEKSAANLNALGKQLSTLVEKYEL